MRQHLPGQETKLPGVGRASPEVKKAGWVRRRWRRWAKERG